MDIKSTVDHVRNSFNTGKTKTRMWRVNQLGQIKKLISENKSEIVSALRKDLNTDFLVANSSETDGIVSEVDDVLGKLDSWMAPERVSVPVMQFPSAGKIYKDPLGVVLIISTWNYPVSIIFRPLIGVIAAGNAAIIKPSEVCETVTPLMTKLIGKYLDQDCIRVIEGGIPESTEILKQKFDKIVYTGNTSVGKVVMKAAAEHLTPVLLELGGKNPLIIDKDCNLDYAVPRICWGKFMNAGQTCIAPDYVFCAEDKVDLFVRKMDENIKKFYGETPSESSDYGKIINGHHTKRIVDLISGGKVVVGGEYDIDKNYVSPTLLTDVDMNSKLMTQEIFGPLLPIIPLKNLDTAIQFINSNPKPLAVYVFSENKQVIDKVLTSTSSGGGCINETIMHNTCPNLPFGGVGASGIGAYNGKRSFDEFTHHKSILEKSLRSEPNLRFPPYTEKKLKIIKFASSIKPAQLKLVLGSLGALILSLLYVFLFK